MDTEAASKEESVPTLRYPIGSTVVPGDRIGNIRQILPGKGTYVKGGHIYSSLVGQLTVTPASSCSDNTDATNVDDEDSKNTSKRATRGTLAYQCSVQLSNGRHVASDRVLKVGQLVVGRVIRIMPQNAVVEICIAQHVGVLTNHYYKSSTASSVTSSLFHSSLPSSRGGTNSSTTPLPPEGAIRMEDIRSGATEQIQMSDCFQPNDWVVCRIVSLGDSRRYYLSTAETELGVIRATSKHSSLPMIPISWKEMECPESGVKELRKCAKPQIVSQQHDHGE